MIEQVTPPSREDIYTLVSVQSLKESKRISNLREEAFLRDCILDAWSFIDGPEAKCRRAVLPQRWAFTTDRFPVKRWDLLQEGSLATRWFSPVHVWDLPVHGARSVVSVTYYDAANSSVVMDPATYWLNGDSLAPRLYFNPSSTFPALYSRHDAIRVVFDAGWPTALDVPRVFRRALLLLAGHFYDNREATLGDNRVTVVSRKIEFGLDALLQRYVVPLDFTGERHAVSR